MYVARKWLLRGGSRFFVLEYHTSVWLLCNLHFVQFTIGCEKYGGSKHIVRSVNVLIHRAFHNIIRDYKDL